MFSHGVGMWPRAWCAWPRATQRLPWHFWQALVTLLLSPPPGRERLRSGGTGRRMLRRWKGRWLQRRRQRGQQPLQLRNIWSRSDCIPLWRSRMSGSALLQSATLSARLAQSGSPAGRSRSAASCQPGCCLSRSTRNCGAGGNDGMFRWAALPRAKRSPCQ